MVRETKNNTFGQPYNRDEGAIGGSMEEHRKSLNISFGDKVNLKCFLET